MPTVFSLGLCRSALLADITLGILRYRFSVLKAVDIEEKNDLNHLKAAKFELASYAESRPYRSFHSSILPQVLWGGRASSPTHARRLLSPQGWILITR